VVNLLAKDDAKLAPQPGQVFTFSPTHPKWVTCDIEFRHPEEKLWPVFFYGKPTEGTFQYDAASPKTGFIVVFDRMAQPHGDQSRRILGELVKPAVPGPQGEKPQTPVVTFSVKSLKLSASSPEAALAGKEKKGKGEPAELDAVLDVDGKKLPLKAPATITYRTDKTLIVQIDAAFAIQGAALGLKADDAKGPIAVRVCAQAFAGQETSGKKK
jgi:hypothetical protein